MRSVKALLCCWAQYKGTSSAALGLQDIWPIWRCLQLSPVRALLYCCQGIQVEVQCMEATAMRSPPGCQPTWDRPESGQLTLRGPTARHGAVSVHDEQQLLCGAAGGSVAALVEQAWAAR